MKILTLIFILIFILFSGQTYFSFTHHKTKVEYKIEYLGLVWVALDYWTIMIFESNDKPLKWIKFSRIEPTETTNESEIKLGVISFCSIPVGEFRPCLKHVRPCSRCEFFKEQIG